MRPTFITVAVSVLMLSLAACGGSGGGGGGSDDKSDIARVVKLAFTTQDEQLACRKLGTASFVARVYGGVAQCIKKEKGDTDKPPTDVSVSDVVVNADAATVHAVFVGGDSDGAAGTVEVRKDSGTWRIDDYGADLLRSVFSSGLEGQLKKNDTFAKPAVRTCVKKLITGLPDAQLKDFAYAAIGDRAGSAAKFGKLITPCLTLKGSGQSSRHLSFVREKFEAGIKRGARQDGLSSSVINCVIKKLRSSLSDKEIGKTVTENNQRPTPAMQQAIVVALTACGAAGAAGAAGSSTQ